MITAHKQGERILGNMSIYESGKENPECILLNPNPVTVDCEHIEYWYAKAEEKDRKGDIAYIRQNLPQIVFKVFEDIGHGGLAALKPELLVAELTRVMGRND